MAPPETDALRCEGLHRVYRQGTLEVVAVRDLSLRVARAEIVAVMGRSGSGKTTLLNLLGCLDRPDAGRLWIGGEEATALGEAARVKLRRARVGFVFQSMNLVESLTAVENVALPLRYAGVGRERLTRAAALLERVGLSARADFPPSRLSGGEQQRVALARALVASPDLVLADEPTGELDSATATQMADLMNEVCRERATAFVIVTHDEGLARRAHRLLRMEDGRLCP